MFHDHETAGHAGKLETYNAVRQHYWWPGLWTFVKNYMKGCGPCQQFKINQSPSHPALMPIESVKVTRLLTNCSMDLIMDLPPVDSFDSILVMVDQGLSKGGNFNSLHEDTDHQRSCTTPIGQPVQMIWTT